MLHLKKGLFMYKQGIEAKKSSPKKYGPTQILLCTIEFIMLKGECAMFIQCKQTSNWLTIVREAYDFTIISI